MPPRYCLPKAEYLEEKRKEFEDLVHCIDKHQTGEINQTKWKEFFTLSDEDLDALHVDLNSDGHLVLMPVLRKSQFCRRMVHDISQR